MIAIGNTLVSEELLEEKFVCDLSRCKGACCVEGVSGAPLEEGEPALLEKNYAAFRPFMTAEGIRAVAEQGLHTVDADGDRVTPLVGDHGACAYAIFENGVAACAIEKAHAAGRSGFQKPVSCHLYPGRVTAYKSFEAVNYHAWDICSPACALGRSLRVPVFRFVKAALVRRFGGDWFRALDAAAKDRGKKPAPAMHRPGRVAVAKRPSRQQSPD
jgi:hypothetical protein